MLEEGHAGNQLPYFHSASSDFVACLMASFSCNFSSGAVKRWMKTASAVPARMHDGLQEHLHSQGQQPWVAMGPCFGGLQPSGSIVSGLDAPLE